MCEYEQNMFLSDNSSTKKVQLQELLWYYCFLVLEYVTISLQIVTKFTLGTFFMKKRRYHTASDRHAQLIALLKVRGYSSVAELSHVLDVSSMTVRRDLHMLHEKQIVEMTHGGVRFVASEQTEPHFDIRTHEHLAAKQAIGKRASELFIEEGDVIGIDSGSTALEVARNLPDIPLTVVTQSLPVATLVAQNKMHQLIMLGGVLQASSNYFYGAQAIATLHEVYINKLFLATSGLLIPEGLSSCYLSDAEIKQAMIRASRKVILCMDSSKIGRVFLARFAPIASIDTLLTDTGISDESREALQKQRIDVIIASTGVPASLPEFERIRDDVAV